MSRDRRLGRSALFDVFRSKNREADEPLRPPRTFSLVDFYAARVPRGEVTRDIPTFALRPGLPEVATVPPFADPVPPEEPRRA